MSRKIIKIAKGPFEVKPQKESVFICMCGLSKNQPFYDGSHKKTLDEPEGVIYEYDEQGRRKEVNQI
ncbi:MAG: iron-binding protein [Candidatus Wildermuthbacteria bacterium RIFCSPLOWO2_12_FULL_40_9]|uniref:Iron-binding protein n=2 Tax=Candidatus Wildermuthiibacteriota TaxID=1817923 RepID=A0A1G2RGT6_9BACT|nr:MAG: iron-binding protein [Candidatus Wildermuthbacteria bacterium RIFCSPHIGHO2_12_FULL_40_12]OHA76146.1 MAG: iron-binding protein [Candidatus Wildermuthbacteria bacterium RIFCSPLOWO2_12_FULL_40_9]